VDAHAVDLRHDLAYFFFAVPAILQIVACSWVVAVVQEVCPLYLAWAMVGAVIAADGVW
jgi:hypothetical protein